MADPRYSSPINAVAKNVLFTDARTNTTEPGNTIFLFPLFSTRLIYSQIWIEQMVIHSKHNGNSLPMSFIFIGITCHHLIYVRPSSFADLWASEISLQ